MNYVKHEKITLKGHHSLDEKWVQARIAEDPSVLGLGDLVLRDIERVQPKAGRLDLLLQEPETKRRYEVELQLGKTDESHIMRTLEYWDIERRRYPHYEHCAVIIAEDITSRFLNLISLFNGFIPLIAIQMSALKIGDALTLTFTTVVDELQLGLIDEDEEVKAVTDRSYWENKGTKATVAMADELLEIINRFAPGFSLKYNKFYIGLEKDNRPKNFATFDAQKKKVSLLLRCDVSDEISKELDDAELSHDYIRAEKKYRIQLFKNDLKKSEAVLEKLLRLAYQNSVGSIDED